MTYDMLRNAKCDIGSPRCRWAKLGRNQAAQSSCAIDEYGRLFTWGQNVYAQSGQGNPYEDASKWEIEYATQIGSERNWVKACSGELSTMALNELGELWAWGDNYDDGSQWGLAPGVAPSKAYTPIRCAPGYLFKDFAFNYYMTIAVGIDGKLYSFGTNDSWGLGIGGVYDNSYYIPQLNPYITEDIKFLDTEIFCSGVVTTSNRVFLFGCEWWWTYTEWDYYDTGTPWEVTGLPAGANIVHFSVAEGGPICVLDDGTVWYAGNDGYKVDGTDFYTSGRTTFAQIMEFASHKVIKAVPTALGSFAFFVLTDEGNIYGYSDTGYYNWSGNSIPHDPPYYQQIFCGDEEEGNRKYIDFCNNEHNQVYHAIDDRGYLWSWGTQWWGPHLAIGAKSYTSSGSSDTDDYPKVYQSTVPILAAQALDYRGEFTTLNAVDHGVSEYIQPIGQSLAHKPCGHWHLRLFEGGKEYPSNCWMPSMALHSNRLLFVASGKHYWARPETGNEILFLTYDIGANDWEQIGYDDLKYAAAYPGGADFRGDIYAYMNYKYDQIGSQWNEAYDNPAMGVWVINNNTGVLEYNEFTDAKEMSGINKVGAYSTGMVAIAYENTSNDLVIYVSTDNGATFNLKKTITTLAGNRAFSLIVDTSGYIYIAYQVSTSSVAVERSINQGTSWTTQTASTTVYSGLLNIKLMEDAGRLYLMGITATRFIGRYSSNDGVSWGTATGFGTFSFPSLTGHMCWVGYYNHCIAYQGVIHSYYYDPDQLHYDWLIRYLPYDLAVTEYSSTLVGNVGVFAYSAWGFFHPWRRAVAIAISMDQGKHWFIRETPLKYYTDYTELKNFDGDPLFYLTDVSYLNPAWKFEKSTWNEDFVKQKDKY